jgi:FSR family fosmidomycin resistance protein-like MFS transporter
LPTALVGGLLAVRFVDEGFGFLPEGAIEQLRADLGVGYATMTVVFAAPFAGSLPALWFTARSDRTGRRAVVLGGTLLMALSLAGFAAGSGTTVVLVASTLWGFGGSLMVHGAELELAALPADAPAGELHRRLRWGNLWGTVGDVAGPLLLGGVLAAGWSYRAAFAVAAAATLVYALWLGRYPFSPVAVPDDEDDGHAAWRDPVAWRLGVYAFFLMPFDETWLAFLIAWLQVDAGLSPAAAALAGILAVLGSGLGFGPMARRTAGRSDRRTLVGAAAAMAVSASIVAAVPAWVAVLCGLAVNTAMAVAWVTIQHAALTLRPGAEGRVMSLVVAIEHTTVVLPVTLGLLADRQGLRAAFAAYLVLGAAMGITGLTLGRDRKPDRPAPAPLEPRP